MAELSKFSCLGLEAAARLEAAIVGWALREACRLVISGMMLLLARPRPATLQLSPAMIISSLTLCQLASRVTGDKSNILQTFFKAEMIF